VEQLTGLRVTVLKRGKKPKQTSYTSAPDFHLKLMQLFRNQVEAMQNRRVSPEKQGQARVKPENTVVRLRFYGLSMSLVLLVLQTWHLKI
jgi:hypothetical protein